MLFRDVGTANAAISFGGGYLVRPNVGVQGSRSAAAIPLLATLLAWGREGVAQRLDYLMGVAEAVANAIEKSDRLTLWSQPQTGINVFRPVDSTAAAFVQAVPAGMLSTCVLGGETWVRSVAANPSVDVDLVVDLILAASRKDT